jgi:hypothetical protein
MILFFGGANCSKCKQLLPHITKLVNETYLYRDIGMEYIDCELPANEALVKACAFTSIPTVTYQAEDGEELKRRIDIQPLETYDSAILYYS